MGSPATTGEVKKAPVLSTLACCCFVVGALCLVGGFIMFSSVRPHEDWHITLFLIGGRMMMFAVLVTIGRAIYAVFSPRRFTKGVFVLGIVCLLFFIPLFVYTRGTLFALGFVRPALFVYGIYLAYKLWRWWKQRKLAKSSLPTDVVNATE